METKASEEAVSMRASRFLIAAGVPALIAGSSAVFAHSAYSRKGRVVGFRARPARRTEAAKSN